MKEDKKSYKNIVNYYIGQVTIKGSKQEKINSVRPLCLIISKKNGYFEEINGNEYLTLAHTHKKKILMKKYEELLWKVRDLIRSVTKNSEYL